MIHEERRSDGILYHFNGTVCVLGAFGLTDPKRLSLDYPHSEPLGGRWGF